MYGAAINNIVSDNGQKRCDKGAVADGKTIVNLAYRSVRPGFLRLHQNNYSWPIHATPGI